MHLLSLRVLQPTWSPHPDLNRGPLPYQGSALPLSYVGDFQLSKTLIKPSFYLERVMGIEPTSSAWKAEVLPLNYTRNPLLLTLNFQIFCGAP